MRFSIRLVGLGLLGWLSIAAGSVSAQTALLQKHAELRFSVKQLAQFDGEHGACGRGIIDSSGNVYGGANYGLRLKASKWPVNSTTPVDLGELAPTAITAANTRSCIVGIAPNGNLLGHSIVGLNPPPFGGERYHITEWTSSGIVDRSGSYAYSISRAGNTGGSIIGSAGTSNYDQNTNVIFTSGVGLVPFSILYQGRSLSVGLKAVNLGGVMVGITVLPSASSSATSPLRYNYTTGELNVLPVPSNGVYADARGLSDDNFVAGEYRLPTAGVYGTSVYQLERAVVWTSTGVVQELGFLASGRRSVSRDIANVQPVGQARWIVGSSTVNTGAYGYETWRAFLKRPEDAQILDLNGMLGVALPAGTYLSQASVVGRGGHIIARANTGAYYLLTPTWEPLAEVDVVVN